MARPVRARPPGTAVTLIPPALLRGIAEIADSYEDAVKRLDRLEALLDGMAAWTPVDRDPTGECDEDPDEEVDEYALPTGWHARKDRDWLAKLDQFNDLVDEFRAAFNATDEPKPCPSVPLRDGETPFDARRYAQLQRRGAPKTGRSRHWKRVVPDD